MKKYLVRGAVGLAIVLFLGGAIFLLKMLVSYRADTKAPEVKETMEQIVEDNKSDIDSAKLDISKVTKEDIYSYIHQMGNTLIVAEDGMIYGRIQIQNGTINTAMYMVSQSNSISKEDKEVLMNVLQAWKDGDYSNGVQAHNYVWKKLKGDIGRARELIPEYKK